MNEADSIELVQEASRLFRDDFRVTQFYDPAKFSGLEVAKGLSAQPGEVAWDIYLFYDGQDKWLDQLPQPNEWVHQLSNSRWAEPDRYYQGDRLAQKMREIMESLLQSQ